MAGPSVSYSRVATNAPSMLPTELVHAGLASKAGSSAGVGVDGQDLQAERGGRRGQRRPAGDAVPERS